MKRILGLLLGAFLATAPAFAQAPPSPPPVSVLSGQAALSVTNSSARVALPSTAASAIAITIYNEGSKTAYFNLGSSSVTATISNTKLTAGAYLTVWINGATNLAAITGGSDTTTLDIYQGNGPLQFGMIGSGGGAPTGACGGDLGGTFPNCTVVGGTHLTGPIVGGGVTALSLTPGTLTLASPVAFAPGSSVLYDYSAEVNGISTCTTRCPINGSYIAQYDVNNTTGSVGGVGTNFTTYTNLGGVNQVGSFFNNDCFLNVNARTGNSTTSGYYQCGNETAVATANDNGTSGNPLGNLFAGGSLATLATGATNYFGLYSHEYDFSIETGASARYAGGVSSILHADNAVAAANEEYMFLAGAQSGATATATCAYCIGGWQGFNPLAAGASVLAFAGNNGASTGGPTIANGIHFAGGGHYAAMTFTGNAFDSTGFAVDGSGNTTEKTASLTGTAGSAAAPQIILNTSGGNTGIYAPASGSQMCLADIAGVCKLDYGILSAAQFTFTQTVNMNANVIQAAVNIIANNASGYEFSGGPASATVALIDPNRSAPIGQYGIGGTSTGVDFVAGSTNMFDCGITFTTGCTGPVPTTFSNATFNLSGIASTTAAATGTMCRGTGGLVTYDPSLGCTSSLEEYKNIVGWMNPFASLWEVMRLSPFWFSYKPEMGFKDLAVHPGFGAHQVEAVDGRLVAYGSDGKLRGVRYAEMSALLASALQGFVYLVLGSLLVLFGAVGYLIRKAR